MDSVTDVVIQDIELLIVCGNLNYSYCKIKGHIAKVCLKRLNSQTKQNAVSTTENGSSDSEIFGLIQNIENNGEINIIRSRNNDKYLVTITIEGKSLKWNLTLEPLLVQFHTMIIIYICKFTDIYWTKT